MTLTAVVLGPTAYWYLTRGSGVVALLLLTAILVLGVLGPLRVSFAPHWPRFAIDALHRDLSLLAVVVVALHVLFAVLDAFAPITLLDGVVPFLSAYRPFWLGLGALAFDLMLALVVTSLLRRRLGYGIWRGVHWLAYACWPIAVLHGIGTGTDAAYAWLILLTFACVLLVAVAAGVRILRTEDLPEGWRGPALTTTIVVPIVIVVFTFLGPLAPDWAARAGTPPDILQAVHSSSLSGARR